MTVVYFQGRGGRSASPLETSRLETESVPDYQGVGVRYSRKVPGFGKPIRRCKLHPVEVSISRIGRQRAFRSGTVATGQEMSNTTTIQPSSVESIPLQPITGRTGISDGNEDVQAEVSTSESQQTSSESQDEAQSASDPASAETDSGSGEPQPTNSTSAVDKWPLRLNAFQVLIGVLAFAGFLAMVYPQVIDHFINRDSLKLSEWTAWMTFRDECRALLNEGKDIGEDCTDVLHQPLPRPPVPLDENYPRHEENITHGFHTASEIANMRKRSTILRLGGFLVRWPAWFAGIFLLPLVLGFWYRKLYRSSQQQSIRRIELYRTWVTDEVARLQPYKSIGYTTGQDTVTWLKTLRKQITVQEYTYTEIQHNEHQTLTGSDQMPEAITKPDLTDVSAHPLSLVTGWDTANQNTVEDENTEAKNEGPWLPVTAWDNAIQNALEDVNSEAANEDPWLPVVNESGDYKRRTLAGSDIHTVELILDKLKPVGYQNFAFVYTEVPENLVTYLEEAHKFPCDYRGYSSSPSWDENMGTFCSIFPAHFLDYLKKYSGHWLIKIPEFSLDTATVCLAYTPGLEVTANWRYWQPDGLTRGLTDSQDAPCLYVMSVGQRHVRLLFENISSQQYITIMNGLRNDEQGHRTDCDHELIPVWDVQKHHGIIQKVLLAASEGSLDTYSRKFKKGSSGPVYEGRYSMYNPNDSNTGSLIPMEKPPVIDEGPKILTRVRAWARKRPSLSNEVYIYSASQPAKLVSSVSDETRIQGGNLPERESNERRTGDEQEKKNEEENQSIPITMSKKSKRKSEWRNWLQGQGRKVAYN